MIFGYVTLLVAMILSSVAAYYSVLGLTAIFSAAKLPVIIMGGALEVGKVISAMWLHRNWKRSPWTYKAYLLPSLLFLMLLTSMGTFGFLSKAHNDQNLVSGDVSAKIAIYDEKIKTAKENIDVNRRALKQMDEAVDQVMSRSSDEKGAEKAVAIRRGQTKDRQRLLQEISAEQKTITQLNEERAPIAAEVRKVEAEVGPIKYIAALVYNDSPDSGVLEKAVRWVIMLIVGVFDPLAVVLILAGYRQIEWAREDKLAALKESAEKDIFEDGYKTPWPDQQPAYEPDDGPLTDNQIEQIKETVAKEFDIKDHPYLFTPAGSDTPPGIKPVGPQVYKPVPSDDTLEPCYKCGTTLINVPGIGPFCPNKDCDVADNTSGVEPIEITFKMPATMPVIETELPAGKPIESKQRPRYTIADHGKTIDVDGKTISMSILEDMHPDIYNEVFLAQADNSTKLKTPSLATFGIAFPTLPKRGDMFLHVVTLPSKLYKFNGSNWIPVDKSTTDSYTYNDDYLKFLETKISNGQITVDDLTDSEQENLNEYLNRNV